MNNCEVIQGGVFQDQRGQIRFVNDFDMNVIRRFYIIKNADTDLARGWRGHRIEQRWFYVLSGAFNIDIVKIDNWEVPNSKLSVDRKLLIASDMQVLHIPAGYCTAFRALENNSEMLVYADSLLSGTSQDNYTWDLDYFENSKIGL